MASNKPAQKPGASDPVEPHTPGEPGRLITNRFLFVDVAALRAKQLKRGALPRLQGGDLWSVPPSVRSTLPTRSGRKLERIAMDEVREGLVGYDLPEPGAKKARA